VVLVDGDGDKVLLSEKYPLLSGISSGSDDVVDDDEEGEFDLMSDEELDPNLTISTLVCKVLEIPSGASDAAVFSS